MNLRIILGFCDTLFTFVWGVSLIEFMLILTSNYHDLFSNVDNGIKTTFALFGLIYFGFKIYFYVHKSKGERKLQAQQIRSLEIENNKKDIENYMFGTVLNELPKDEFERSKKRMQ